MQRAATVDKSLDILEAVSDAGHLGLGIRGLARRLKINPTTVYNLAWTLCERGYLRQTDVTRRFVLGPACVKLAGGGSRWRDLARMAEPLVRKCQLDLDESIMLAALDSAAPALSSQNASAFRRILSLVYIPSSQVLRVDEPDVMAERAYGTAVGKMLLSTLEDAELAAYLEAYPPQRFTSKTLATPAAVRKSLAEIRLCGYAEAHDELTAGVSAVAVLVEHGPGARCLAGLGASAPTVRMDEQQVGKTLATLRRCAERIRRAWSTLAAP
jgi:IclR family transcriptional regulator, acetate operon repressor